MAFNWNGYFTTSSSTLYGKVYSSWNFAGVELFTSFHASLVAFRISEKLTLTDFLFPFHFSSFFFSICDYDSFFLVLVDLPSLQLRLLKLPVLHPSSITFQFWLESFICSQCFPYQKQG